MPACSRARAHAHTRSNLCHRNQPGRHAYAAISGLFLCYFAYGAQPLLLLVIPCCASYMVSIVIGRNGGRVVALISLSYLLKWYECTPSWIPHRHRSCRRRRDARAV